jgi:L-xylulokinase
MSGYVLGVDSGLTVTKAIVFDEDGTPRGTGSVPSEQSTPRPGWVEKDPDEQWAGAARAIGEALRDAEVPVAEIAAIGVTGHGDGLYVLDADRRPVRPAITSLDGRGNEVAARLEREGVAEEALELVGEAPFGVQPAVLAAWLKEHERHVYDRIAHVLFCKDWLKLRLTGEITTDPTEASAGLTDLRTQRYAPEVLGLYGIPELEGALPPVVASYEVAGEVTAEAGAETGLRAGTPVVSGLHDCDASAVGSGGVRPGLLTMIAGTFSINEVISDDPVTDPRVLCRNWVEPGQWMNMGNSPASATNLEWFVRQLCPLEAERAQQEGTSPFGFVEGEVEGVLGDDTNAVFLPFLYGSADSPEASATLVGLKGWHTRGHVLRALFEGVAFNHRTHVDALRDHFAISEARLTGGGARSPIWSQTFANVLGLPVGIPAGEEAGALGAAICAGVAGDAFPSVAEGADRTVRLKRTFEPDPRRRDRLAETYETYLQLTKEMAPVWGRLA